MTEHVNARAEPRSGEALLFLAARIVGLGMNTGVSLYLVRALSVEQFGTYSAAIGVFLLVSALSYMGCDQLFLAGRMNADSFKWLVPRLGVVTAGLGVAVAVGWPGLGVDARITLGLLSVTRALDLQRGPWILGPQLTHRHLARARRELAVQAVIAVAVIGASTVGATSIAAAAGGLAASLLLTVLVGRPERPASSEAAANMGLVGAMKAGLGFAASSILYTGINVMGLALLPLMSTIQQVAHFRASMLIYGALLVIPVAVNNDVMRPHLYQAEPGEGQVPLRLRGHLLNLNLLLGLAIGGSMVLLRPLVEPVLGDEYSSVGELLPPLALAAPCAFIGSYVANRLIVRGGLGQVVKVQASILVLAVVVNALLIPDRGALGAAQALFVVEFVAVVVYVVVWRLTGRRAEVER